MGDFFVGQVLFAEDGATVTVIRIDAHRERRIIVCEVSLVEHHVAFEEADEHPEPLKERLSDIVARMRSKTVNEAERAVIATAYRATEDILSAVSKHANIELAQRIRDMKLSRVPPEELDQLRTALRLRDEAEAALSLVLSKLGPAGHAAVHRLSEGK